MARREEPYLNPEQLAELSALADGTLDASRRPAVEAAIAASSQLRERYERERLAVWALHQAAAERAPARLRAQIDAQLAARGARARRRVRYGGLAGALAAIALVFALVLPGGTPGSPSVSQAAQLALRGPSAPAPTADPTDPRNKLVQRLQQVYFPNWSARLGWRTVGARRDNLDGRPAVTVYYQQQGRQVAYTIVGAPVLAQPSGHVTDLNGAELRSLRLSGRTVVTWRRSGHTCVLSARAVSVRELEQLAAWRTDGLSD